MKLTTKITSSKENRLKIILNFNESKGNDVADGCPVTGGDYDDHNDSL